MILDSGLERSLWRFSYWECLGQEHCVSKPSVLRGTPSLPACKLIVQLTTPVSAITAALQKLGYDGVYHMTTVISNVPDALMWRDAFNGEMGKGPKFTRKEWDQLLGDVQCAIDFPAAGVLPALIAAYPEAKILVCERDIDKWWASMKATILTGLSNPFNILLWLLDTDFFRPFITLQMTMGPFLFGPKGLEEQNAKAVYREKYAEVRRLVPEGRRLEWKLEEGWEPLCRFLGKEIPDEPFPRINEGQEWHERAKLLRRLAWERIARKFLPVVLFGGTAVYGIYRMQYT